MRLEYCIIGNSAAAVGAVEAIRKIDLKNSIAIVSSEPYHVYSRPLIPYLLSGKIPEEKMYYREKDFYEKNMVTPILGKRVIRVDVEKKKIKLDDDSYLEYSKLLLAVGAKPIILPVKGLEKEGVSTFTSWDDVKKIREKVEEGASKALVIGAGLIGLKAAESLKELGLDVTVVVRGPRVLRRIVDEASSKIVENHLTQIGIQIITRNTVKEILGKKSVEAAVLADGRRINCELVIMAVGVQPNIDLAKNAGINVNDGILVNNKMETNISGVYAAGDVTEAYNIVYGKSRVTPLWPNAYKQGYTAGVNMAGEFLEYQGSLDMNSIELFGLPIISVGLTNPPNGEYESLVRFDGENTYKKIVLKDDRVVGVIFIGNIDRAGIFTGLIRDKVSVKDFKDHLLEDDFGYVYLPESLRKERLLK
jgi:NAD(P)H-nitrite reductase large subunit